MRLTLAMGFCLLAGSALAQANNLPELFTVKGVAASDKLNIRSDPNASSDVIGTLNPNQSGIEVVAQSADGSWSKVNDGEGSGWVASKFLEPQPDTWVSGKVPTNLICSGTEPFWSLDAKDNKVTFRPLEGAPKVFGEVKILDRGFDGDRNRVLTGKMRDQTVTAVIQPAQCSDGMSDRTFGLSTTTIFQGGKDGTQVYYGCCSISK